MDYWVLDGHEPRLGGREEWARMFENEGARRVAQDTVGPWWVSTVFLGIDHSWGDGPPLLFETMIFNHGTVDEDMGDPMWRWTAWDEAELGHMAVVQQLRDGVAPRDVTLR